MATNTLTSLADLFLDRLAEMHNAETKLALALPLVAKEAKSEDLKKVVVAHTAETKGHADCIEHVAESLGRKLPKRSSAAMNGLLKETVATMLKNRKSPHLDALLIASAQRIEHFEISSYGTLCAWAKQLGYTHEYALLTSVLDQERLAEAVLTGLAHNPPPLNELIRRVEKRVANSQLNATGT